MDIQPFKLTDILNFGRVNIDLTTETFDLNFYLTYINKWGEMN